MPFVAFDFGSGKYWSAGLIQSSILRNCIVGLGNNRKTVVLQKLVFIVKVGLNLESSEPNYDIKQLILERASKRMYPDTLNYDYVVKVMSSFKTPMKYRKFLETK
ncbi:anaerobic ribonucleoside-triphosphate reductase [Candidatus Enterovibrio escicola]|uniref:anaerobic ribonucleoside-triphosphate reductase n=1 Tax=Candidatus Enterovibrio escicola TaxID=1927127 RepID=UPI001237FCD9|nr:anaerobic ribonucleoside-triphosphate reductase [Candidatus Enterovibrio escacola]